MATESPELGVSDQELFESTRSDEQPEQKQPEQPVEAQPEAKPEPARDEHGRFAAKTEQPEEKPAEPPAQEQQPPAQQQPEAQIPSWRLREERERREAIERQFNDERMARARLEEQMRQLQAQMQPQQPPPDMFADPEAWQRHLTQTVQSTTEQVRYDLSEDWARDKFGNEKVNAALDWMGKNLGPAERERIRASRNPYREMVSLYDERQTLQQIGGDLTAYRNKVLDEALNDQTFMQKVADRLRAGNQPANPTNGQRPVVQLPPSLNRAPGASNQSTEGSDSDMSDSALFRHATAR